jgi:hypothetical protein
MNETNFWLCLWALVIAGLLTLCGMDFHYTEVSEQKVVDMVKAGANPIQARCSLLGGSTTDPTCLVFLSANK